MTLQDDVEDAAELLLELDSTPVSKRVASAFFFLGMGALLPWNAVLSALDFYAAAHPTKPTAQYLTNAYTFPFMVFGVILLFTSTWYRGIAILTSFSALSVVSAILPVLPENVFWETAFATGLLGGVGGLLQSTLYGVVNLFPGGSVTTAFNAGGGVASVLIVGLRILSRLVLDGSDGTVESLRLGFRVFFAVCTLLCAACIIVFYWLHRRCSEYRQQVQRAGDTHVDFTSVLETLKDVRGPAACLLACFSTTMMLFPGIIGQLPLPQRNGVSKIFHSWYPLLVVAFFSLGDALGRGCWSSTAASRYPSALRLLTAARTATVPLYVLVWVGVIPSFVSVSLTLVLAHGFMNGFLMNMSFLAAPKCTSEERREMAGRLMFIMLISGLFLGSATGWAVDAILHVLTGF